MKVQRLKWEFTDINLAIAFFKKIAEKYIRDYQVDSDNQKVIEVLIKYFHGYTELILPSGVYGDPGKGIMLMGAPGTGKTMIMKIFSDYVKYDRMFFMIDDKKRCNLSYPIIRSADIVKEFMTYGWDQVDMYAIRRIYCYDDLGEEPLSVAHYGTRANVMQHLLETRYNRQCLTMATTNHNLKELGDMYGERVESRLQEMFNLITMTGKDRRNKV